MPHLFLLAILLLATACGPSFVPPPSTTNPPPTDGTGAVDGDGPQGQLCNNGECKQGTGPLYCCDKFGCPSGERCVDATGAVDTCDQCAVSCDCPQGQLCADGQCVLTETPVYCCDALGCPINQGCVDLQEQVQTCPPECTTDCDCPQGLACSSSGLCLETTPPTYCCDNEGCPDGEICRTATGDRDVCGPKTVEPECGNGMIEDGETCDGNCPTSCDDGNACTTDTLLGPGTCAAECRNEIITSCQSGDGCCPMGCSFDNDTDCPQSELCGNGRLDAGEACDGSCPTSCNDNDACTTDVLTGSAAMCTAQCSFQPQTQCVGGDGCCPNGCSNANDSDCAPPVGNGLLGDPCVRDSDCGGANTLCVPASDGLLKDGYCTRSCANNAACGANTTCTADQFNPNGFCLKTCNSSADCRSPGYTCTDTTMDNIKSCVGINDGPGRFGDPCEGLWSCGGDATLCARSVADAGSYPGGLCTQPCGALTGNMCPGNAVCFGGSIFFEDGTCLPSCTNNSDCRAGWTCQTKNNPQSGSNVQVCVGP